MREIARRKFVASFGDEGALDALEFRHRFHARSMLNDISQQMDGRIPFSTWLAFTTRIPLDDIPKNRRTYRGLVLGDTKELQSIKEANEQSLQAWREEMVDLRGQPQPLTSFFLGILDLSNDQTLRDSDVWKFRSTIAPFLVYLNLSLTQLTDSAISTMAAGYGEEDAYTKLEVLILHHVTFTDAIAKKLARFTTLRMLGQSSPFVIGLQTDCLVDVRNTRCSRHFMSLLNTESSPSPAQWNCATRRKNSQASLLEFQLFGPSYAPSHIITLLHELATWIHDLSPTKSLHLNVVKPFFVHIDSVVRAAARPKATGVEASLFSMSRESNDATTAHHKTYGGVYSSVPIARGQLEEDGANEKGGGGYGGRDDEIATGGYSGVGREGGRVSLYEIGLRKVSPSSLDGAWSDGGSDGETEEAEAFERRVREEAEKPAFYRQTISRPERKIVVADYSTFMLIRHCPLPDHNTHLPTPTTTVDATPAPQQKGFNEGSHVALKMKRRISTSDNNQIDQLLTPFAKSAAQPPVKRTKPADPKSQPSKSKPNNPFAKSTRPFSTLVQKKVDGTEQKREGPPQRGGMAAFRFQKR